MLDAIDDQILKMLLASGRVSYTDISKGVGLKPPSVIERIKRLETEGIITGYTAQVDYSKLGYSLTAYIGVTIDNPERIVAVEEKMRQLDNDIVQCHHVTGDFTLMLKIITKDTYSLGNLIKKLRNISGITKTNTMLVFSTLIDRVRSVD